LKRWLKRECLNIFVTFVILALMTWGFVELNNHIADMCNQARKEAREEFKREEAEQKQQQPIVLQVTATAYCHCPKCTGKSDGITYTGTKATEGKTIAVDPNFIPLGTTVYINGQPYVAEDTGRLIKGNKIDIYMSDHKTALKWGVQELEVEVLN
jgi:3D (Asp-Asp-Asp) domain-containing protein